MSILENQNLIGIVIQTLFQFVGFGVRLEIDDVPAVFLHGQYLLDRGVPVRKIHDVRGTSYLCHRMEKVNFEVAGGKRENGEPFGYDYDELKTDKKKYAAAYALQYRNNDAMNGKAVVEYYDDRMLVQNPPMPPLEREELDRVYNIPFCRTYHPMYEKDGGIPAIKEVKFSITHNRGCFGGCNFCAIAYHQGRAVRSRSVESVVEEAKLIASMPDFKGYIHDIGGPTANFRHPACKKQLTAGVCPDKRCLVPTPCKNLDPDHSEYVKLLSEVEKIPGIKKVFIRSGIRYDYMLLDRLHRMDFLYHLYTYKDTFCIFQEALLHIPSYLY